TSPAFSNACLYDYDVEMQQYCINHEYIFTRYSDDIIISSENDEGFENIHSVVSDLLGEFGKGHFKLNSAKTKLIKKGSKIKLLGMVILPSQIVSVDIKMKINIEISKIQHVEHMSFAIDLSENKLTCIVGKNGAGKTTLIKAIKNLQSADTFIKTSSRYIFNPDSSIVYNINDQDIVYVYDENLKVIDTKQIIPADIKSNLYVELPIPHGMRFNNFPTLSKIDTELRKSIAFESYSVPEDLINILNEVYQSSSYNNLKAFSVKNEIFYFRLNENGTYIREDYFSSGEYFILNLFRMIELKRKFIVIDEIDISLDSSAQVHLIAVLRKYCQRHSVNIVFTTHSLALMQTLNDDELYYMCEGDAGTTITNRSYNYIKSTLFGFKGWDKYILTEDEVLQNFLEYIINAPGNDYFYEYKIIYVG
ncbi:AAA family ATPase, partial [Escherichia coli]|nr:AAA family ATPase [Escherichia coli]